MSKEIPKIFHNEIKKKLNNNEDVFYSANKVIETPTKQKNIQQMINQIFHSPNYVYKANVIITTKDATINKKIIGRNNKYLITMDNQTIPIDTIIDIKIEK